MQFDGSKFFVPSGKLGSDLDGSYNILVELVDSRGKSSKEKMELVVDCEDTFLGIIAEAEEELIEDVYEIFEGKEGTVPNPRITKFNGMGELFIGFDMPMNTFNLTEI